MNRTILWLGIGLAIVPGVILVVLALSLIQNPESDNDRGIPHSHVPQGRQVPTRGAELFQANCVRCHVPYLGRNRTGKAPRLEGYLSESWLYRMLANPDDPAFFGATKARGGMESCRRLGEARLAQLAGFLSRLHDADGPTSALPAGLKAGLQIFKDSECETCHSLEPGEPSSAPNLAGYGSERWLAALIEDAGSDLYYGARNGMPSFKDKLTPPQIADLIAYVHAQAKER